MKEIILRKSISRQLLTATIFIILGFSLIYLHHNRILMTRKGEGLGGAFVIIFSIKLLIDCILYNRRYVLINTTGIYDHSSILFSGNYYWNKIVELDVTQSTLIIHEENSCWTVHELYITQDNLRAIDDYREKLIKIKNI